MPVGVELGLIDGVLERVYGEQENRIQIEMLFLGSLASNQVPIIKSPFRYLNCNKYMFALLFTSSDTLNPSLYCTTSTVKISSGIQTPFEE